MGTVGLLFSIESSLRGDVIGNSASSSDSEVEQKTDSGSRGVLAPPVDFDARSKSRRCGALSVPVGPFFIGDFLAGDEVSETPIAFRANGKAIGFPPELSCDSRRFDMEIGFGGGA